MKALERIGTQGFQLDPFDKGRCQHCGFEGTFLLRAFRVMREIAIEAEGRTDCGGIGWKDTIDEEFEERLKCVQ